MCPLYGYAGERQACPGGFGCSHVPSDQTRPCRGHAATVPAKDRRPAPLQLQRSLISPKMTSVLVLGGVQLFHAPSATCKCKLPRYARTSLACDGFFVFFRR